MKSKIEELKELLKIKETEVKTDLDKEKINNIKFLLEQEDIFFKLETPTALGILEFLGIKESEMRDYYLSLISIENLASKGPSK